MSSSMTTPMAVSSSPGSKNMAVGLKSPSQACVCGREACRKLSQLFASIDGDVRAGFFQLPASENKRNAQIKSFRLERIIDHLNLNGNDSAVSSQDDRDQSAAAVAPASPSKTRSGSAKKPTRRKILYVAKHHYHPEVLQQYVVDAKDSSPIDYIHEEFVKETKLLGNGYSSEDKFVGQVSGKEITCYVPVPSYSLEKANRDYILASNRLRLQKQVIEASRGKFRGETFLASRSNINDDALKKFDELPKLDENNIEHLQRAVCMLADKVDELTLRNEKLEEENKEVQMSRRGNNAVIEEFIKERKGGLCRISISSDAYHKKNPNVAKKLFGLADRRKKEDRPLSSWEVTKNFIRVMFAVEHEEPTIESTRDRSKRNKKLSRFEQVLITLMFFTNAFDYGYISTIFGCEEKVVGRCIKGWAPFFREVGYHMARLPLTKEFLDKTYPTSYHDLNFTTPVATVVDGTDVLMETVRTDRYVNISQASSKLKSSACRGITWSTPMGMVHEFTDPFFARGSEKAIVALWTSMGRLADLPDGYLVSGDKGFDSTSVFYPKYNPVIHPAFLTGGDGAQFTVEQMDWNRQACKNRYTSEVVFSRVKMYGGLSGIIRRHHFHYLRDMWAFAHGMANMFSCIQRPHNCPYFPNLNNDAE
jgi:hypothetical protein